MPENIQSVNTDLPSYMGLRSVLFRNLYYQGNYHKLVLVCVVSFLLFLISLIFNIYQHSTLFKPKYFPSYPDGQLLPMPAVSYNHLTLDRVKFDENGRLIGMLSVNRQDLSDDNETALLFYWIKKAILAMFSMDYINYRQSIQNVREYFTPSGFVGFKKAFVDSRNLETIRNNKAVVFATINGDLSIYKEGIVSGHKAWKVHVPITVTYENPNMEYPLVQNLKAEVYLARVSTLKSEFWGLQIISVAFLPN